MDASDEPAPKKQKAPVWKAGLVKAPKEEQNIPSPGDSPPRKLTEKSTLLKQSFRPPCLKVNIRMTPDAEPQNEEKSCVNPTS
eukprot:CAMPEP_0184478916 /NCGR_PEP_ID=MMETSP0113_2-20130426/803_1 /TAXON_ID=91329 /ORGANISM="Norrisiella sphaerica, Strain BC52" /LENGTH=82 /DNA_ID=CAMNT_0026856849 /DNA_START=407 /DNA_END=655 /DNA_ORIENTATION=+